MRIKRIISFLLIFTILITGIDFTTFKGFANEYDTNFEFEVESHLYDDEE